MHTFWVGTKTNFFASAMVKLSAKTTALMKDVQASEKGASCIRTHGAQISTAV